MNLTHDSFRAGAESLTDFTLPGGAASLSATKLGADDLVRLAAFDHTEGDGQTVPVTDLIDVFPSPETAQGPSQLNASTGGRPYRTVARAVFGRRAGIVNR